MTTSEISAQYATGLSRQAIEQALLVAGKDIEHLTPADLGTLEDFHTLGRIATAQLAELAAITSQDRVLDAGAGIGGTARSHLVTAAELRSAIEGARRLGRPPRPACRQRWGHLVLLVREECGAEGGADPGL